MGEMGMKKGQIFAMLFVACMQLEYIENPVEENAIQDFSGSGSSKLQMNRHELEYKDISYYQAILICNEMSLADGLDTLYQYDKPVLIDDSLFWLPNIKILGNRSGYRLPTKEEWLLAKKNGDIEKLDENVVEWLYGESNSQYGVFELAPNFLKAVGLYREREGYPTYGMRVVKVISI